MPAWAETAGHGVGRSVEDDRAAVALARIGGENLLETETNNARFPPFKTRLLRAIAPQSGFDTAG